MKAFLLHGAKDLRAADLPRPVAGPGDVVLAMRRAGICGSDIHYFSHGYVGSFMPRRPFVLGHEFAGEIVEVGAGVPAARIGEHVTVDPSMPCGQCEFCRGGRYNLCVNMRFYGSASCDPHIDGGFEEFIVAPSANAFVVPDALTWGAAAMTEPLSVAVHAALRAGSLAGRSVLVTGGGTIGQLTALVARVFGAGIVALGDILPCPRRMALDCGATGALDALSPDFPADADALAAGGFDVVIEASGSAAERGDGAGTDACRIVPVCQCLRHIACADGVRADQRRAPYHVGLPAVRGQRRDAHRQRGRGWHQGADRAVVSVAPDHGAQVNASNPKRAGQDARHCRGRVRRRPGPFRAPARMGSGGPSSSRNFHRSETPLLPGARSVAAQEAQSSDA